MRKSTFRSLATATLIAAGGLSLAACTTTQQHQQPTSATERASIDSATSAALTRLYNTVPGSAELVAKSAGVLVFPSVVGGSFVIGADHGKGELLVGGKNAGYYSITSASIGLQAGASSKAVIYVFNTQESLAKFRASNGWTVGADATVAVATVGANGSIDTQTIQAPVVSFVMNNAGVDAGVSLQGSKISRIHP